MTQVQQGCRCRELHNHAKEEAELRVVHSAKVRRSRRQPCIIIADDAQQATNFRLLRHVSDTRYRHQPLILIYGIRYQARNKHNKVITLLSHDNRKH